MAVNIEQLPQQIRDDVEDQSLDILQQIQQHIVVIGGWAVRSHTAYPLKYARYTLDIDAVAAPGNIKTAREILSDILPVMNDGASYEARLVVVGSESNEVCSSR